MAILAIAGKINSGKDLTGSIIQYLTSESKDIMTYEEYQTSQSKYRYDSPFIIKKFADKLKDMVCLLINCTREQLEDADFKNTELDEEWTRYAYAIGHQTDNNGEKTMLSKQCSKEIYEYERSVNWQTAYKTILTPRLLLQLLGTNCGRDIIHNNIWVNSLMSGYKREPILGVGNILDGKHDISKGYSNAMREGIYPNWIITDCRFPNELQAVKDKDGISIRINRIPRAIIDGKDYLVETDGGKEHESETALNNATFDYVIDNDGTIEELIGKVKEILIKEKIITNGSI